MLGFVLFRRAVFPTPVGVFPSKTRRISRVRSLPHARGGVSAAGTGKIERGSSSPRPWGCFRAEVRFCVTPFVFPTPVGVFPAHRAGQSRGSCLPHARGGVSTCTTIYLITILSSPRPWGCFCHGLCSLTSCRVFPTPVGVFRPLFMRNSV